MKTAKLWTPEVFAAVEKALRCTRHIPERDIRARYIATTLRIDGFVIQKVARDSQGRFRSEPRVVESR